MRYRVRPQPLRLLSLLASVPVLSCRPDGPDLSPGVSWSLAQQRSAAVAEVRYGLTLHIPESVEERIHGLESITLTRSDTTQPIILDFRAPAEDILSLHSFGSDLPYEFTNGHIVVPASELASGTNIIEIEFLAGDLSLNRNEEFLYTLFVPDRASTAFPCFDQPNIKGTYQLTLVTPESWRAVANGSLLRTDTAAGRVTHTFGETRPISSYLFSFAAGRFQVVEATRAGRVMQMYHRETHGDKVARNEDAVFDLHAAALDWLEDYTGIAYPFDKFDFVLIPSFQYGGMEHPGAILYRSSRLLLDESATQSQRLGRASLIAHETAHMWFGDLVTMNWFDDVWTKEVFANFMAAKIVNPSFPEIDHDLRFFLSHYPAAYGIDRTEGPNPIRQELENLLDAGTLYGPIIYQKAPIVMRQLEWLTGEDPFRQGMQEYLSTFSYRNATWPDLIDILDGLTQEDLRAWSAVWVEEPNRPTIATQLSRDGAGGIGSLTLIQSDPAERGRLWNQQLGVTLGWDDSIAAVPVQLRERSIEVTAAAGLPVPRFVLAAGEGAGYGLFKLDSASQRYLLEHLESIPDPLARAAAWVTIWDALLEAEVAPQQFLERAHAGLQTEQVELVVQRILSYTESAYWRFLPEAERSALGQHLETLLWDLLERAPSSSLKATYFRAYMSIAVSDSATQRLLDIWRGTREIPGLTLSESDYIAIAQELALRDISDAEQILTDQLERIENPDRKASFEFVLPALSTNPAVREAFFESLRDPANREHEPWVLTGVSFLHHPLRARAAEQFIRPSLEMLEEIQLTGDIFFPQRWLGATFSGHSSPSAAGAVRDFLSSQRRYPPRLRQKILQSADLLFRSSGTRQ
ncbi:MAG: ERAP1-like C-terminal domain-containing protein [Gemmatimonadota bacterium]|nr:MAG: ERAP1-like C-terminal domain-containing protein [Gemmatimonadota bacterium]